jgi:hypothetical protein
MTDQTNNLPPPEIENQFTNWLTALHHTLPPAVRAWFDQQRKAAAQPRSETAEHRFARQFLNRPDKPPQQPAWQDPRPQQKGPRYG